MGKLKIVLPCLDVIKITFSPRNVQWKTIFLILSELEQIVLMPPVWASHDTPYQSELIQHGRRIGKKVYYFTPFPCNVCWGRLWSNIGLAGSEIWDTRISRKNTHWLLPSRDHRQSSFSKSGTWSSCSQVFFSLTKLATASLLTALKLPMFSSTTLGRMILGAMVCRTLCHSSPCLLRQNYHDWVR